MQVGLGKKNAGQLHSKASVRAEQTWFNIGF
jgi:hypothetical protein